MEFEIFLMYELPAIFEVVVTECFESAIDNLLAIWIFLVFFIGISLSFCLILL